MKTELITVLRAISKRLDAIDEKLAIVHDEKNGLAAIRLKLDMVTDDHDAALERHAQKFREMESNGHGKADAE